MKGVYLAIIAFFLVGMITSLYLLLSPEDYALMLLKGEKYPEAEVYYKNRYAKGDRSASTLIALKTVEIAKGDNDKAIALLEEYLKKNPSDLPAHRLLGELYLNGQRRDAYLANLERIKILDSSREVLEELATWYHARGDKEREKSILAELIQKGWVTPQTYFDLAYLVASEHNYSAGYRLMEQRNHEFPRSNTYDSVIFEIALLLEIERESGDRKKYDPKILSIAHTFILEGNNAQEMFNILNLFHTQKRDDLSYQLKPTLKYLARNNRELAAALIELEWSLGDPAKAYSQLIQLYRQGALTGKEADLLVRLSLDQEYYLILTDVLEHTDPRLFSEGVLLTIAQIAVQFSNPQLAAVVVDKLGSAYLHDHPILAAALALASDSKQGEKKLKEVIQSTPLTISEALTLMHLAALKGYPQLALEMGSKFFPLSQMSSEELMQWALIYIGMDRASTALKLISQYHGAKDSLVKKQQPALILLYAALKNMAAAEELYALQKKPEKSFLINLYLLAEKGEAYPFALHVAEQLYLLFPSVTTDIYYATALLNRGEIKAALERFGTLIDKSEAPQVKMGYLKSLALAGEGYRECFYDYLNLLRKSRLTEGQLRDIGYLLIEKMNDFTRAQEIFWTLVQTRTPTIEEGESFLYLVGPAPPSAISAWALNTALKAPLEEKLRWVKALYGINETESAVAVVNTIPSWRAEEYLLYLTMIRELQQDLCIKAALPYVFNYLSKADDLEYAAALAGEYELPLLQKGIFERLTHVFPCKAVYWKSLGNIAYGLGDFTSAFAYFCRYFALYSEEISLSRSQTSERYGDKQSEDPLPDFKQEQRAIDLYSTLFFYGDLLLARNDPLLAEEYYWSSLNEISHQSTWREGQEQIKALIYARMQYKWIGLKILQDLYCRNPSIDLKVALATVLMEMGRLNAAQKILYQESIEKIHESTFVLQWKRLVDAQVEIGERDILMTFSLPLSDSNIEEVARTLPLGIQTLKTGLHSLLVTTSKPATFALHSEKDLLTGSYYLNLHMTLMPTHSNCCVATEGQSTQRTLPLDISKVNLALRQRNYTYAASLLAQLNDCYPHNVDILNLTAALLQSTGKWEGALNWLAHSHQINGHNEPTWVAYRDIYFPHSPFAGFEREAKLTHQTAAEQRYRLQGEWILSRNLFRFIYFLVDAELDSAHISQVFTKNGLTTGFRGKRGRAQLRSRNVNIYGTELDYIGYVGDGIFGGGLRWLTRFDQGFCYLYADWNRPYWEILECLVHQGNENRAGAGGEYVYNARLNGGLDVGLRQYGISGQRSATSTIKIGGNATLYLTLKNPIIALNYILDGEYVVTEVSKRNPFGAQYNPVPLSSRENHTLRLVVRAVWRKWWACGGFVGETFNRLGTHNFTIGVNFHYYFPCGLEFDFLMERYPSTTVLGEQVDDIRGGVKWRF